jgi:hypothetical protein
MEHKKIPGKSQKNLKLQKLQTIPEKFIKDE